MAESDGSSATGREKTFLDRLEQISRISVPAMIPIVVAIVGYLGNDFLNARQSIVEQKKLDVEYVKIAKEIVTNVKPDSDRRIVNWAYQTLFQLSPIKVSSADIEDLSQKRTPLPSPISSVVGGVDANMQEWQWLVALTFKDSGLLFCGGTLIAPDAVMTTAHCASSVNGPTQIAIAAARSERASLGVAVLDMTPNLRVDVKKVTVHPNYKKGEVNNDIGILQLSESLGPPYARLSGSQASDPVDGILALVAAYGSSNGRPSSINQVAVPIANQDICSAQYPQKINQSHICAGFKEGGADACQGSSGGPLAVYDKLGRKYQVGIVSWGDGCGTSDHFGVYTRISTFRNWIAEVTPNAVFEGPPQASLGGQPPQGKK